MRRSQRIARLAHLREAEVLRARAALSEALRQEAGLAAARDESQAAQGRARRALAERAAGGARARDLALRADQLPLHEASETRARAGIARLQPEIQRRRAVLAQARTRQESLERFAERLADEERRELLRREQLLADELGTRPFARELQS